MSCEDAKRKRAIVGRGGGNKSDGRYLLMTIDAGARTLGILVNLSNIYIIYLLTRVTQNLFDSRNERFKTMTKFQS